MDYRDLLVKAVADRAAVVVVGTGVSKALSGNEVCADWFGLVDSGIGYAKTLGATDGWEKNQRSTLEYAREEADQSALIAVASQVQTRLKSVGHQAYYDWLRESVGALKVSDNTVARSLRALDMRGRNIGESPA